MTEEIIAWLRGMDWQTVLATTHIAGMVLVICAAVAGYTMGVRLLFLRGPRPARALVGLLHNSVVLGLVIVWCSGGGLLFAYDALADPQAPWPAALTFKLTTVALLSFSIWLGRVFVLPLARSRRRPLAASLGWGELVGVSFVASTSISCWMLLLATVFSAEMQVLPVERLFGFLAGAVVLLAVACLALAACVRALTPRRRPDVPTHTASRRRQRQPVVRSKSGPELNLGSGVTSTGGANQAAEMTGLTVHALNALQSRPLQQSTIVPHARPVPQQPAAPIPRASASLGNRMHPPQNQQPAQQLRDKVAQEWSRNARPQVPRPRWTPAAATAAATTAAAAAAEADERLLHKWLRRQR